MGKRKKEAVSPELQAHLDDPFGLKFYGKMMRAKFKQMKVGSIIKGWTPGYHRIEKISRREKGSCEFYVTYVTIADKDGDPYNGQAHRTVLADVLHVVDKKSIKVDYAEAVAEAETLRGKLQKIV